MDGTESSTNARDEETRNTATWYRAVIALILGAAPVLALLQGKNVPETMSIGCFAAYASGVIAGYAGQNLVGCLSLVGALLAGFVTWGIFFVLMTPFFFALGLVVGGLARGVSWFRGPQTSLPRGLSPGQFSLRRLFGVTVYFALAALLLHFAPPDWPLWRSSGIGLSLGTTLGGLAVWLAHYCEAATDLSKDHETSKERNDEDGSY